MSMQGKITTRDGQLFVLYETAHTDEPKITRLWWAVTCSIGSPHGGWERPKDGDLADYSSGSCTGQWSTRDPETHRRTGGVETGSGSVQAVYRETVDAPAPKIRKGIESRWSNGRWQKALKSGWVDA